jgi:hypothetical protein
MKRVNMIGTAILSLLFAATAIAYAQPDRQGNNRGNAQPAQQHQQAPPAQQHQQAQPAQQHQQAQPAQQHQQAQPAQQHSQPQSAQQHPQGQAEQQSHQPQGAGPAQHQPKQQPSYGGVFHGGVQPGGPVFGGVHQSGVPQQQSQVREGFTQSRAGSWKDDHRSWAQRGGYNGYRIPDARFRLYFGREHFFRIYGLPLVFVGGLPRFQYDGYWVTIVDPWPESWGPTWYETDDVYLDNTGDGYYLYDRNYPDIPIAVTVSF